MGPKGSFRAGAQEAGLENSAAARIPDVVLRVLPDARAVEVQVTRSSAPPPPTDQAELDELSMELAALAQLVRSGQKRGPLADVGPEFSRCLEPRSLRELLSEQAADRVTQWIARAFERGARTEGTYQQQDEDGSARTFQVTVLPGDADGVVTIRDITFIESSDVFKQALEQGDLSLCYSPRVDGAGRVVGATASLHHGSWDGPLATTDAVENASGVRADLDEWAVHAAVRHIAGSTAAGYPMPVAVSVSGHWLHRKGMVAVLSGLLECYGAKPELLELRSPYRAWYARGISRVAPAVIALGCKVVVLDASANDLHAHRPPANGCTVDATKLNAIHSVAQLRAVADELSLEPVVTGLVRLRDRDSLASMGLSAFEGPCFGAATDGRSFLRRVREAL